MARSISIRWILSAAGSRRCVATVHVTAARLHSLTPAPLDFWSLPDSRLTHSLTERVEKAFYSRCPPDSRPSLVSEGAGKVSTAGTTDSAEKEASRSSSKEHKPRQTAETKEDAETTFRVSSDEPQTGLGNDKGEGNERQYDSSLLKALHTVFWVQFWIAGFLKFVSGM